MLSRQFYRHLMVVTDVELAAEIQTTADPEASDALSYALRQREAQHRAIDLIGAL